MSKNIHSVQFSGNRQQVPPDPHGPLRFQNLGSIPDNMIIFISDCTNHNYILYLHENDFRPAITSVSDNILDGVFACFLVISTHDCHQSDDINIQ